MTYETINLLSMDGTFQGRVRACMQVEADIHQHDNPASSALCEDVLRGGGSPTIMGRMAASEPAIAAKAALVPVADLPRGVTVDQSGISDEDILGFVQAHWDDVATIYFSSGLQRSTAAAAPMLGPSVTHGGQPLYTGRPLTRPLPAAPASQS